LKIRTHGEKSEVTLRGGLDGFGVLYEDRGKGMGKAGGEEA